MLARLSGGRASQNWVRRTDCFESARFYSTRCSSLPRGPRLQALEACTAILDERNSTDSTSDFVKLIVNHKLNGPPRTVGRNLFSRPFLYPVHGLAPSLTRTQDHLGFPRITSRVWNSLSLRRKIGDRNFSHKSHRILLYYYSGHSSCMPR